MPNLFLAIAVLICVMMILKFVQRLAEVDLIEHILFIVSFCDLSS